MSENLAEFCKDFVTTLVFRYDVVPRLSAYSIESMMVELANASPAKKTVDTIVQHATSAIQSIKQKFVQLTGSMEKDVTKNVVADLRWTQQLAEDSDVVARALRDVEEAFKTGNAAAASGASPLSGSPSQATAAVQQANRSFSPLFPPGRVLWLFGSNLIDLDQTNNSAAIGRQDPWWEQLQTWSKEKIISFQKNVPVHEDANTQKSLQYPLPLLIPT